MSNALALLSNDNDRQPPTTPVAEDETQRFRRSRRKLVAGLLVGLSTITLVYSVGGLPFEMRMAIMVFAGTLISWTITDLPETPVALTGALVLVVTGTIGEADLFKSFGNEIIWLLIAAFVISAVLQKTGLAERLTFRLLAPFRTVTGLFWAITIAIFLTAFVIPSTSARAAILMPVFAGLSVAITRPAVTRALALLFPSVILLSAAASMTGAAAHLIAVEFMYRVNGKELEFASWILLAGPFALLSSLLVCGLILGFFLGAEDRTARIERLDNAQQTFSRRDKMVLAAVAITVALWLTGSLHGVSVSVVAIAGALVVASELISGISFKVALKHVEWNLLLFLAATLVIGEALLKTGAAPFLINGAINAFRHYVTPEPWLVVLFAAIISSLAHILITSRTARATVLIPTLALPLAGFGVNPSTLILTVTLGSGFCQTLMVSAKPVTLFGGIQPPTFSAADLLHLSILLLAPFIVLLAAFAIFVWPLIGIPL